MDKNKPIVIGADHMGLPLKNAIRDYLLKKGLVTSTETFIELAATKSSISGKPYQVRCGKAPAQSSQSWFASKLKALRGNGRR